MKEQVIKTDIYDASGTLLISKGTRVILTDERSRQLKRLGIFEDVVAGGQFKKEEIPKMNSFQDFSKQIEMWSDDFKQIISEVTTRFKGVDIQAMQNASEVVNRIVFESKSADWYRFVSVIHYYLDWMYTHSINTSIISCLIATKLGYNEQGIFEVALGALFHDIGLTLVPKEILNKPGKLTDIEYKIVQNHCEMGYSMLKDSSIPEISKNMILNHHEKLDGSGYPNQLFGLEINEQTRILAVAEYFDTATTSRAYKMAEPARDVLDRMYKSNDILDRRLVEVLIESFL